MMMGRVILVFVLGIVAALIMVLLVQRTRRNTPHIPPWHPFEVRSDLTLDDLVADGYRLSDMPCGMVHFAKTLGDTTIRYWINIDCTDYSGKYIEPERPDLEFIEEEIVPLDASADTISSETKQIPESNPWMLQSQEDPYWPFDADEVRGCHQHLNVRYYSFTMETIDSLAIRLWVEQHGGIMYSEDWTCSIGGYFIVKHLMNNLLFDCSISRERDQEGNFLPWKFKITTDIPFLDQEHYNAYLEEEKRKDKFYGRE